MDSKDVLQITLIPAVFKVRHCDFEAFSILFAQSSLYCLYHCFSTFSTSWTLESLEKIVENSDSWAYLIPTTPESQNGRVIICMHVCVCVCVCVYIYIYLFIYLFNFHMWLSQNWETWLKTMLLLDIKNTLQAMGT